MEELEAEPGYDIAMNFELFFAHPGMFAVTVTVLVLGITSVIVAAIVVKMYSVLHRKQHRFMTSLGAGSYPACKKSTWILVLYVLVTIITSAGFLALFFFEPHVFP